MSFMDRLQKTVDQGLKTSRELFAKAKEKAKDLSEIGVLRFEVKQLESQAEKLTTKLGATVFDMVAADETKSVGMATPDIKEIVSAIRKVQSEIDAKELELKKYEK